MALQVDTSISFGNACDIQINEKSAPPEVAFAADPHGGPETLWFCFRVRTEKAPPEPGGSLKLVLKHAQNMLGGGRPRNMRPVLRRPDRDWTRLPPGTPEDLPDGRVRVSWSVEAPAPWLELAYCYPYGRPELECLRQESGSVWRSDTLGLSQAGRPLVRLANDYGAPGGTRPGVYLLARQHAGETSGAWVLDGFLRRLAEQGERAPLAWAVPFANVDGVEQGDYGKDNFPYDLNRAWGQPPMRHEVLVIQRDMRRWKERCRPRIALDFHAPGACEAGGIYAFVTDPAIFPAEHHALMPWTQAFARALTPEFSAREFARVAHYASRWETPRFTTFCRERLGLLSLSFEIPYALCGETLMTRKAYREAGRRLADAVASMIESTP